MAGPFDFNCPPIAPPNSTATNVRSLHAHDIKVMIAMGDSVTAGFGMMGEQGIERDFLEYRGQSWSIGGSEQASTLATFFNEYHRGESPVVGASLGEHEAELCWGYFCPSKHYASLDVLNTAMSGAMMYNFVHGPGNQIDFLMKQLDALKDRIDIERDWKVLTIFVGANDMCIQCEEIQIQPTSPDDYEKYFRDTLQALRSRIPRLFVNVVQLFNVSMIYEVSLRSEHCVDVHRVLPIECACAFKTGEEGVKRRKEMDLTALAYNQRLEKVTREIMAQPSDSFAAVLQPVIRDGSPAGFPLNFISTLDCFHPSLAAHQAMAKVIWNAMWTPAAKKTTTFRYMDPFVCPTANSTLQVD